MHLNEDSLQAGDLRHLVDHIFEIDNYRSKMGTDKDVCVLSFTVETKSPAEDMVNFIEKGYKFVLDADTTPGELEDGKYKVFVELERNRDLAENICNILYGIKRLTDIDLFKFRYYKSFNSIDAVKEQLEEFVPLDPNTYEQRLQERKQKSAETFFAKTIPESLIQQGDILQIKKVYADPIKFKIINYGTKEEVISAVQDKINVNEWAEIIFLTKYFGDFNITKFGDKLMFEDNGQAVLLERQR